MTKKSSRKSTGQRKPQHRSPTPVPTDAVSRRRAAFLLSKSPDPRDITVTLPDERDWFEDIVEDEPGHEEQNEEDLVISVDNEGEIDEEQGEEEQEEEPPANNTREDTSASARAHRRHRSKQQRREEKQRAAVARAAQEEEESRVREAEAEAETAAYLEEKNQEEMQLQALEQKQATLNQLMRVESMKRNKARLAAQKERQARELERKRQRDEARRARKNRPRRASDTESSNESSDSDTQGREDQVFMEGTTVGACWSHHSNDHG